MSSNIPQDESGQVGNVYAMAQALCQEAVREGYERHAIAEALMYGARYILADDSEFEAVFDRFRKLHFPR